MPDGEAGPGGLLEELDAEGLRDAVRDLGACLMLSAIWAGRRPQEIVGGLLDVLVSILRVDVAHARLDGRPEVPALEERRPHHLPPAATLGDALGVTARAADPAPPPIRPDWARGGALRLARRRIGLDALGTVTVGSGRATFPTKLERFLLDAAVNQAAVALQTARLIDDLHERDRLKDQQAEVLATINEVSTQLSAELDLQKLVQLLTDAATRITRAAFGAFFYNVVDERGGSYTLYTLSGAPREAFAGFAMPRNTAVFGPTFRGEGIVRLDDVTTDPRFGQNPPHHGFPRGHLPVRSYLAVPVVARSGDVLGGLFLGHPDRAVFTERDEQVLRGLAAEVAIAIDNARLYEREHTARRVAERSEGHARFLAEASSLLISSLDVDTILGRLARLAVPVLADLCSVDMLTPQGTIARVAVAHVDPAKEDLARVLRERYPFHPDDAQGVPRAIRTGTPQFWPDVTDALLRERAHDAAQVDLLTRIGVRSAVIVPLVARGRTLGALTFVLGEGERRYTEVDLAVAEDLARRAALAIDNARLYREAEAARAEAEAASRAKDEFLAVLSHELRTPLNAVLGWARILRAAPRDAGMLTRGLEVVERNAEAQTQLIEDLLDMARITTGKLRLDVRPVELLPVVQAAVDALRPAAAAKGIRLETILDPRAGPIGGDPARLQQIVWNLVSNAVKFTGRGGRVQVRLQRVSSHVEIVVSDTGQGIPPDVLPTVFHRFTQADSSSTRSHGGLGLGLALVQHLVELHGGTVSADSPGADQGATFRVTLPPMIHAEPNTADRTHPTAATPAPITTGAPLAGLRVIVVDDDRDAVELFTLILVQHGAEVRVAASAAEALAALAAWPANVLLSDIEMQGEDGYELIKRVRALPPDRGGTIPAAAVTAYGRMEDRVRALGAGFQIHVPKPVEPRELVAVVANLAHLRWTAP